MVSYKDVLKIVNICFTNVDIRSKSSELYLLPCGRKWSSRCRLLSEGGTSSYRSNIVFDCNVTHLVIISPCLHFDHVPCFIGIKMTFVSLVQTFRGKCHYLCHSNRKWQCECNRGHTVWQLGPNSGQRNIAGMLDIFIKKRIHQRLGIKHQITNLEIFCPNLKQLSEKMWWLFEDWLIQLNFP